MKILKLDIETAPHKVYVWGLWGQDIGLNQIVESGYTLCWAAQWLGEKKMIFDSIHQSTPKQMIKHIHSLLEEADAVIHYNGKKFDIPVLNQEFLLHGLPKPSGYIQIDLYSTVKQNFRFASNKLDYVCQRLGIGAKVHHKGMDLWRECMAGDEKSWELMARYNKMDVILLEDLYLKLLPWIKQHPNVALYNDDTRPQCPHCGSQMVTKVGMEYTRSGRYQRYRCKKCKTPIRGEMKMEKEKRRSLLKAV